MPLLGTFANRGLNLFLRGALRTALEKHENMTPEVRAGYLAPYDSWHNRVAVDRFVKDIPRTEKHPSCETLLRIENGLTSLAEKPWIFLWGMRDWCFHEWYLNRFLDFIPQADVHRFTDGGHLLMEDKPAEVVQLVKAFLSKHSGA
jgi:haloalkane dehalogenase